MPRFVTTADRIDYWIRRRVVPCPTHNTVNPATQKLVGLTAIGRSLKDQYDALVSPIPPQLATLIEQLKSAEYARVRRFPTLAGISEHADPIFSVRGDRSGVAHLGAHVSLGD